jgi:hypothetical protein
MHGIAMALFFAILDGNHSRIILSMKQKARKGIMKKGGIRGASHPDKSGNGDGESKTGGYLAAKT